MKYDLEHYGQYLTECEKSKNTIEKYLRDVRNFLIFSDRGEWVSELDRPGRSPGPCVQNAEADLPRGGAGTDARRVPEASYDREPGESRAPVLHPSDHRGNGDADRRIKISDSGDSKGAKDTDRF